jgi:hypothetical protein
MWYKDQRDCYSENVIAEVNLLAISSALSLHQTYGCTDRNSALEGHAEISPSSVQVQKEQDKQCTYNVILTHVRATIVAGEKQYVLYILSVCL